MITILAALALAIPVHCYPTEKAWEQQQKVDGVSHLAIAYYDYHFPQRIAVGPIGCREMRRPTHAGANLLAHELAHHWQFMNGRTFDEKEADRIANWADDGLLIRMERVLGRKAPPLITIWLRP